MDKRTTSQTDKGEIKGRLEMKDIRCKTCIYYRPQIGVGEELSGQLEGEEKPFGYCRQLHDPVREEEWCGQWKDE